MWRTSLADAPMKPFNWVRDTVSTAPVRNAKGKVPRTKHQSKGRHTSQNHHRVHAWHLSSRSFKGMRKDHVDVVEVDLRECVLQGGRAPHTCSSRVCIVLGHGPYTMVVIDVGSLTSCICKRRHKGLAPRPGPSRPPSGDATIVPLASGSAPPLQEAMLPPFVPLIASPRPTSAIMQGSAQYTAIGCTRCPRRLQHVKAV